MRIYLKTTYNFFSSRMGMNNRKIGRIARPRSIVIAIRKLFKEVRHRIHLILTYISISCTKLTKNLLTIPNRGTTACILKNTNSITSITTNFRLVFLHYIIRNSPIHLLHRAFRAIAVQFMTPYRIQAPILPPIRPMSSTIPTMCQTTITCRHIK